MSPDDEKTYLSAEEEKLATPQPPKVVVVGMGASAGGIEAFGRFFDAMPADSGAAFVLVLHLDPTRESQMAHVLSAHTTMPVLQVADGAVIPGIVGAGEDDGQGGAVHGGKRIALEVQAAVANDQHRAAPAYGDWAA